MTYLFFRLLGTDCQDCGPVGADNFTRSDDDGWWDDDDDYLISNERPNIHVGDVKIYRTQSHAFHIKGDGFIALMFSKVQLKFSPPLTEGVDYTVYVVDRTDLEISLIDKRQWRAEPGPLIVTAINTRNDDAGWIFLNVQVALVIDDEANPYEKISKTVRTGSILATIIIYLEYISFTAVGLFLLYLWGRDRFRRSTNVKETDMKSQQDCEMAQTSEFTAPKENTSSTVQIPSNVVNCHCLILPSEEPEVARVGRL